MNSKSVQTSRQPKIKVHKEIDTNQVAMKMTKEAKDKTHGKPSSQQTIQDPTKDLMDPTRGDGHKREHQLFFLLVFLRDRICCK